MNQYFDKNLELENQTYSNQWIVWKRFKSGKNNSCDLYGHVERIYRNDSGMRCIDIDKSFCISNKTGLLLNSKNQGKIIGKIIVGPSWQDVSVIYKEHAKFKYDEALEIQSSYFWDL